MSEQPQPAHKTLLAAKLVMGTLLATEMVAAAQRAVESGELGAAVERLAETVDIQPNVTAPLMREWLQASSVALPSPAEAWHTIFDYYFAAAVLVPTIRRKASVSS